MKDIPLLIPPCLYYTFIRIKNNLQELIGNPSPTAFTPLEGAPHTHLNTLEIT